MAARTAIVAAMTANANMPEPEGAKPLQRPGASEAVDLDVRGRCGLPGSLGSLAGKASQRSTPRAKEAKKTMINIIGRPMPAIAAAMIASAAMALAAVPAGAQEPEADARMAELQVRLEEARERLGLSDEQVEQLLPVVLASFEGTMAVLEEHGIDVLSLTEGGPRRRLNLRQLRALGRDLDDVREAMFEKIEELGFLSEEQFAEFKKIQEEQRAALRERLRARRGLS